MAHAIYRCLPAAAVVLAALGGTGCQKETPPEAASPPPAVAAPAAPVAPVAEKPAGAPTPEAAAKAPEAPQLSPAEEKRLVDMAKTRKAADGASVWEVIENAEQQRPGKFKVAIVDIDYKKDGTPAAVTVCYWIGQKRLEEDQSCQAIGWEIAPDKQSLQPYKVAATQAVEAGRDAFLQAVDQMYDKKCGAATGGKPQAKAC